MAEADLVGAILDGRYRVLEPLGHGAMGTVYRGERIKLGRAVAIKVLHDSLPHELAGRKRFELEARAMAQLEHPHCVAVLDVGLHEGRPYVVMDFVSGTDLRTLLAAGRLEPARVVALVKQVLSGLAHAHELGIVHRDIKPANLMVGHKTGIGDQVKILDFGLARSLDPDSKKLTTGMVVGTPSYMAPEQCRGGAIDPRTDLYAVGVLLFELLTGRKPFESKADDPVEVVGMHLHRAPPRLADMAPDVPWGELEGVVARALAKAPQDRYASAVELSAALDAALARNEETVPFEPVMLDELAMLGVAQTSPANVAVGEPPGADSASGGAELLGTREAEPDPANVLDPVPPVRPSQTSGPVPADSGPASNVLPDLGEPTQPISARERLDRTPTVAPLPAPRPPPRLDSEPAAVQQQRMYIAAGVIGAVVILAVVLRACGPSSGAAKPVDAGLVAVVPTPDPIDAAVAIAPPVRADAATVIAASDARTPAPDAGVATVPASDDPAGAALARADQRARAHDVTGALQILAAAHRQFVANPDIPYAIGRLELGERRYASAVTSLREAVQLFPGYQDDPDLAKVVVAAYLAAPSRQATLERFLRDDLRHAAVAPLAESRDHGAEATIRDRATAELNRLK